MAPRLLDELHKEHRMVEDILNQLEDKAGATDQDKETLFDNLERNLLPHMRGEEKYFYPALLDKKDAKADALHAIEEHRAADNLLMQLDETSMRDDTWDAKLVVLKDMILHHVKDEEGKVFKDAKRDLSDQQMDQILDNFMQEKNDWLAEQGIEGVATSTAKKTTAGTAAGGGTCA